MTAVIDLDVHMIIAVLDRSGQRDAAGHDTCEKGRDEEEAKATKTRTHEN